ncbi:hypothetical protein Hydth_1470 [Hydrogenobacter thermophilus TK-6]|uniref:Uncharacterized protein n=2 Tax=Hydrogenobacter thermophilus TaxID=940 RepID=D3DJD0_HYDTT|nr:hypothetical protein [Hydrogenobacter thermophilus]ADO45854.1 hypothetical protein Hydth_1470 [Hydrogenobacter thermophilus TK-6]BAI69932.1 hypothetical protein HTH_1482 [Hydrogenobacter thermophilus TK-6]
MMSDEGKKRLLGILLGLLVLAGFMTGFLGMALSEKNREYFIYRLKNIKKVPYIAPEKR